MLFNRGGNEMAMSFVVGDTGLGEIVLRHATVTRKLSYPAGIRRS